jgi:hypothetical protein
MTTHRIGWVVEYGGEPHEVVVANECRTRLRPIDKVSKTVTDKVFNKSVTFEVNGSGVDIAPTTLLKVIGRIERKETKRETCCGFLMPVGFDYEPPKELQHLAALKPTKMRKARRSR